MRQNNVFVSGVHESQDQGGVPELHRQADLACEAAVKWSTGGRLSRSWGPWDEPAKHAATAADADAATAGADEDDAGRWSAANDARRWNVDAAATATEDDDAAATAAADADDAAATATAADDGRASEASNVCRWWTLGAATSAAANAEGWPQYGKAWGPYDNAAWWSIWYDAAWGPATLYHRSKHWCGSRPGTFSCTCVHRQFSRRSDEPKSRSAWGEAGALTKHGSDSKVCPFAYLPLSKVT